MKKSNYISPEVEVVEMAIEQGIAVSEQSAIFLGPDYEETDVVW